jgi:NAD(P)-dependent dehydrogenase (short-subunit alcohol dehydrogenase family)
VLLKGSAALIVGSAQGLGLVCAKASYIADETIYMVGGRLNLNLYFFMI